MEQILYVYYADNAKRLRQTVDRILSKFGGLSDKDTDDFYSLANEVFTEVLKRYDNCQPFDAFLYSCLLNKIKTEMTRRNREKRMADRISVSIDAPVGDGGALSLGDTLTDSFDIEREVFGEDSSCSLKIDKYLGRLSRRQQKIVRLLASAYKAGEIRNMLNITRKEYADAIRGIRSYENISVLF